MPIIPDVTVIHRRAKRRGFSKSAVQHSVKAMKSRKKRILNQAERAILGFLAVIALLTCCGCNVLSTQVSGIPNTYGITENRERVAATGDPSECDAPVDPATLPPAELNKMSLPTYQIEPPDILLIDAIRIVPKNPYYIQSLDILQIVVAGALPEQPIAGQYQVDASGIVNLGPSYGPVKLEGLTTDEAQDAIRRQLRSILTEPEVAVTLLQASGTQQVAGEHLVGPDGTINLGTYGSVYLSGLTVAQARAAVEDRLSEYFDEPMVSVDVFSYNSKVYYIITEGPAFGDQVVRGTHYRQRNGSGCHVQHWRVVEHFE